jgi:hypothetical protein
MCPGFVDGAHLRLLLDLFPPFRRLSLLRREWRLISIVFREIQKLRAKNCILGAKAKPKTSEMVRVPRYPTT